MENSVGAKRKVLIVHLFNVFSIQSSMSWQFIYVYMFVLFKFFFKLFVVCVHFLPGFVLGLLLFISDGKI